LRRAQKLAYIKVVIRIRILEWGAPLAFIWFAYHGRWPLAFVFAAVSVALVAKDMIARPILVRTGLLALLSIPAGLTVCWGTGFLVIALLGDGRVAYVGPGIDSWNLPGTVFGSLVAIWLGFLAYRSAVRIDKSPQH